jgi:hypothetical protein
VTGSRESGTSPSAGDPRRAVSRRQQRSRILHRALGALVRLGPQQSVITSHMRQRVTNKGGKTKIPKPLIGRGRDSSHPAGRRLLTRALKIGCSSQTKATREITPAKPQPGLENLKLRCPPCQTVHRRVFRVSGTSINANAITLMQMRSQQCKCTDTVADAVILMQTQSY